MINVLCIKLSMAVINNNNYYYNILLQGVSSLCSLTPCTCFVYSCVSMVWKKGKVVSIILLSEVYWLYNNIVIFEINGICF